MKDDTTNKENYRRRSILLNLSKIYQTIIYDQICSYLNTLFSKFQCGFRFNAQHCFLLMIKNWREVIDNGEETGGVLTDLSEEFDYIYNNLLVAKLNAYGVEKISLDFTHFYLLNKKHRTKIESSFTPREGQSLWDTSRVYLRTTSISTSVICFLKHSVILPLLDIRMTIPLTPILQTCKLC